MVKWRKWELDLLPLSLSRETRYGTVHVGTDPSGTTNSFYKAARNWRKGERVDNHSQIAAPICERCNGTLDCRHCK